MNPLRDRTNWKTYAISLLIGAVGVLFLIASEEVKSIADVVWEKAVCANFGALLIGAVGVALLWELASKRAFLDELMGHASLVEAVRLLRLVGVSTDPLRGPSFPELIRETSHLDIFVCWANTWRNSNEADLRALAAKMGARARLIVPDPDNQRIMDELACRFEEADGAAVATKIRQAIDRYKEVFAGNRAAQTFTFEVWVHREAPVTSFFLFDHYAVVSLYKHARGRGQVPTLVGAVNGTIYEYASKEVRAMIDGVDGSGPLATRIYP